MPSTREIRRRIRSVKNIAKVTKAMETVAAAKMRKAQQQVLATRPYAEKSWEVLTHLARLRSEGVGTAACSSSATVKKVGAAADHRRPGPGRRVQRQHPAQGRSSRSTSGKARGIEVNVVTVGRKGRDLDAAAWAAAAGRVHRAQRPADQQRYRAGRQHPDRGLHRRSSSTRSTWRTPTSCTHAAPGADRHSSCCRSCRTNRCADVATDYIFEPDPQTILNEVLRGLTELQILQAIYESIASEESARMVAMRNATEAANDLIGELTLSYNKARQEAITKELLDIVGGASALDCEHEQSC